MALVGAAAMLTVSAVASALKSRWEVTRTGANSPPTLPADGRIVTNVTFADAGTILVNGQHIERMTEDDLLRLRADVGMLFQESALFDSQPPMRRRPNMR